MKHTLAWIGLGLSLMVGCNATIIPVPPPIKNTPVVQFELDAVGGVLRRTEPLQVGQQVVHLSPFGYGLTGTVTARNGTFYQLQFTVQNNTKLNMGTDGEVLGSFVNLQALNAEGGAVAGSAVVNASGYHATSFDPYFSITESSNVDAANPLPIEPGSKMNFAVTVQVPEGATRLKFGFVLRAAQGFAAMPLPPNGWLTPAFGRYNYQAFEQGSEEKTRFSTIVTMASCPGEQGFYLVDTAGLWKIGAHHSTFLKASPEYTVGASLACNQDGLFLSSYTTNRVYKINAQHLPEPLLGTGEATSLDGPGTSATLHHPNHITTDGTTLYFSEIGSKKIRKATRLVGGGYNVSTVYALTDEEPHGVALDQQSNIFFNTSGGIWRFPVNGPAPVKVYGGSFQLAKPVWHPSGHLLLTSYFGNQVEAYSPTETDLSKPWKQTIVAGNGEIKPPVPYAPATEAPLVRPFALVFDQNGTLFVGSYSAHVIYRIDVLNQGK